MTEKSAPPAEDVDRTFNILKRPPILDVVIEIETYVQSRPYYSNNVPEEEKAIMRQICKDNHYSFEEVQRWLHEVNYKGKFKDEDDHPAAG